MYVEKTIFKNIKGICVKTRMLEAIFLPEYGGKLASLKDRETGCELLAQDANEIYLPQSENGIYINNEVSGVDDLFPTIDPCRTGFANNEEYPCHGEVLRYAHKYSYNDNMLKMEFKSLKFSYIFTKEVRVNEKGALCVSYRIENTSEQDFPCIFGLHCMLAAAENGKILLFEENENAVIMFDELNEYGKSMENITLTEDMLMSKKYDENANTYKFYVADRKKTGKCGYYNPEIDKNIVISYDAEKIPYLGIWMNNGRFKAMYNATLEPCTMPYDSVEKANKKGYNFVIKSNCTYSADIIFALERN